MRRKCMTVSVFYFQGSFIANISTDSPPPTKPVIIKFVALKPCVFKIG